jgi:hypothetical protein
MLGKQDQAKTRAVLEKFLPLEEAEPTFFDRAADWLSAKFPLEKPH